MDQMGPLILGPPGSGTVSIEKAKFVVFHTKRKAIAYNIQMLYYESKRNSANPVLIKPI